MDDKERRGPGQPEVTPSATSGSFRLIHGGFVGGSAQAVPGGSA